MLGFLLAAAVSSVTFASSQMEARTRASFWVDAERFSPEDVATLSATLARMVDDDRLALASHREDADLIFAVRLGSFRDQSDGFEPAPALTPVSDGPDEPGRSNETQTSSVAAVEIALMDVMQHRVLSERTLRCRAPLFVGTRVSDAMLRAGLSSTADEADGWVGEREPGPSAPETEYGPSDEERRSLPPARLAEKLRVEASRALRAGYEETALSLLADAQPMLNEMGERHLEGLAWEELSALMASTGRPVDTARTYAGQAVKIARETNDPVSEARALVTLAVLEAQLGHYPRSLEVLYAARQMAAKEGDVATEASTLANIAALTALRGGFERARSLQEDALELLASSPAAPNTRLEARLRLAMAVIEGHLDARDRAETLHALDEVLLLARELGDLSLEKDTAFVEAAVRFATTDYAGLKEGELAAIRAYRLSRETSDRRGETAALALLGAFAHRLVRPSDAAEYLARALAVAREQGYVPIAIDTLQLLGEMAPNTERGLAVLDDVLTLRREQGDLRGEVKTLSDQTRLLAGLGETELAWERYRQALAALERYVALRKDDPYAEDIRGSFIDVLKSMVATRTEMPFLVSYLELRNAAVIPHLAWTEALQ